MVSVYYQDDSVTLYHGDCLEVMSAMPDSSVDAVVTDPPYGLSKEPDVAEVLTRWLSGERYEHGAGGFMGAKWDSFVPGPEYWREAFRVLKPGGHLLCFAGTRCWDLVAIAIRLAGFTMRDTIASFHAGEPSSLHWLYGQGFSKGVNVSKAFDKMAGAEREVTHEEARSAVRPARPDQSQGKAYRLGSDASLTLPATDLARQWDGWHTGLKPAHEPVILARKPLSEPNVAANVARWGTGAINVDGCRVTGVVAPRGGVRERRRGFVGIKSGETIPAQPSSPLGRYPSNVILTHHPECEQSCHPACALRLLDEQSGESVSRGGIRRNRNQGNPEWGRGTFRTGDLYSPHSDSGGASRFFYCAKASQSERNAGCSDLYWKPSKGFPSGYAIIGRAEWEALGAEEERIFQATEKRVTLRAKGNIHATVKPLALMRYLVRLVTPPGGTVLDPFAGSGTTGVACRAEGFKAILVEQDEHYCAIDVGRVTAKPEKAKKPRKGKATEPGLFKEAES